MEVKWIDSEKVCPCRKCDEIGKYCTNKNNCIPFKNWFHLAWSEIQKSAKGVRK